MDSSVLIAIIVALFLFVGFMFGVVFLNEWVQSRRRMRRQSRERMLESQ